MCTVSRNSIAAVSTVGHQLGQGRCPVVTLCELEHCVHYYPDQRARWPRCSPQSNSVGLFHLEVQCCLVHPAHERRPLVDLQSFVLVLPFLILPASTIAATSSFRLHIITAHGSFAELDVVPTNVPTLQAPVSLWIPPGRVAAVEESSV